MLWKHCGAGGSCGRSGLPPSQLFRNPEPEPTQLAHSAEEHAGEPEVQPRGSSPDDPDSEDDGRKRQVDRDRFRDRARLPGVDQDSLVEALEEAMRRHEQEDPRSISSKIPW